MTQISGNMIAVISDDDEFRRSLRRYLILRGQYPAGKVAEFQLSAVTLADLNPYDHLILHVPRIHKNGMDHFGLAFCAAQTSFFSNKSALLLCIDDPKDCSFSFDKLGATVPVRYLRLPVSRVDLLRELRMKRRSIQEVGMLPCQPKSFPVDEQRISLGRHLDFYSALNSVSLLVGAFLSGELARLTATESITRIIRHYLETSGEFTDNQRKQMYERLAALRGTPDEPDDLALTDYVHNKTILLIDDQQQFGWGEAIGNIFYPNGCRRDLGADGLPVYHEEGRQGKVVCASTQEQGLQFLASEKEQTSLIILDLHFGGRDPAGLRMLDKIRNAQKEPDDLSRIPVLVFSASYGASTIIEAFEDKKADAYFCKAIEELVERKHQSYEQTLKEYFRIFRKAVIHSCHKRIVRFRSKSENHIYDDIRAWLNQFSPESRKYALTLLEHIDFRDTAKIRELCRTSHEKLVETIKTDTALNAFYIGVGHPAKSGTHVLFYYRHENLSNDKIREREKNESVFLSVHDLPHAASLLSFDKGKAFYKRHKIVLVDDIVGSGKQFVEEFERILEYLPFLQDPEFHDSVYYVALLGLPKGVENIVKRYRHMEGRIFIGEELSGRHQAFSEFVFPSPTDRRNAKRLIKTISMENELYFDKEGRPRPFGHHNDALLIAFEHNTPNNTLPIFWAKKEKWMPLFERKE
jgi:CheY-like chemotaxis protein